MRTENRKGNDLSIKNASMIPGVQKTWAVVADTSIVKIFERNGHHFDFVEDILKPDMDVTGLNNNTLGRGGAYGAGRHKYEPSMQESRQEQMALARTAAAWLDQQFTKGSFDHLVLIAAPEMLGEMRKVLSRDVSHAIIAESNKQFTGYNEREVSKEILKVIPGPDYE